jgi:membrane-bound metal-dependent hydrolase YbcI (DUF457 family)
MDPLAHASVALLAKPTAPKAPLWAMIAATQVPDLLFFAFEAAGLEQQAETTFDLANGLVYLTQPTLHLSHGLVMTVIWSLLVGGLAFAFLKEIRPAAVIGALVFSHWFLDFLVYPILPVAFAGSPRIGLGLITYAPLGVWLGILIEIVLIVGGIVVYWRYRKNRKAKEVLT